MNVLFYYNVTINSRFGGIAHVTYYLGEYFKSIGWNVFFLSVNRTSDDQVDYQYYLPNGRNKQAFINEIFFLDFVMKNNISVFINQSQNILLHCCKIFLLQSFLILCNLPDILHFQPIHRSAHT